MGMLASCARVPSRCPTLPRRTLLCFALLCSALLCSARPGPALPCSAWVNTYKAKSRSTLGTHAAQTNSTSTLNSCLSNILSTLVAPVVPVARSTIA